MKGRGCHPMAIPLYETRRENGAQWGSHAHLLLLWTVTFSYCVALVTLRFILVYRIGNLCLCLLAQNGAQTETALDWTETLL